VDKVKAPTIKEIQEDNRKFLTYQYSTESAIFLIHYEGEDKKNDLASEIHILVEDGFIITGCYAFPDKWKISKFDEIGNAIYCIPFDYCIQVLDAEDLQSYYAWKDVDEEMLRNAH
jgi:hypothetical protein